MVFCDLAGGCAPDASWVIVTVALIKKFMFRFGTTVVIRSVLWLLSVRTVLIRSTSVAIIFNRLNTLLKKLLLLL